MTIPSAKHIKKLTDSPLPEVIYFDTSFLFRVFREKAEYQSQCLQFISRLEKSQPIVIMSQLVRLELWNATTNGLLRRKVKYDLDQALRDDPHLIDEVYPDIVRIDQDLSDLMQRFKEWLFIETSEKLLKKALLLIKQYKLRSYDAIHLATMQEWGVKDIAAFDWAFEDMTEIDVWTHEGEKRLKERCKARDKVARRKKRKA